MCVCIYHVPSAHVRLCMPGGNPTFYKGLKRSFKTILVFHTSENTKFAIITIDFFAKLNFFPVL